MADLAGVSVTSSPAAVIERPRTGSANATPQSSPATTGICEFLDWDSKFFGIRIARVAGLRLDAERVAEIARAVREQSIDCLYFLAEPERDTIQLAELQGFQLINVRVTLVARLLSTYAGTWQDDGIREAAPADIPALREIAGHSYTDSRFYQDGRFPAFLCDEMYRGWIEKSCHGYADIVLVAEQDARPAGYVCCHLKGDGSGQIGLMGAIGGMKNPSCCPAAGASRALLVSGAGGSRCHGGDTWEQHHRTAPVSAERIPDPWNPALVPSLARQPRSLSFLTTAERLPSASDFSRHACWALT